MNLTGYRLLVAALAILCGWLAGQPHAEAATEWQNLLSEDFSQGEVSFYTGQASEAFYGIDDQNRYIIDGLNTEIDSLSALTKNLYYYYVEAECELVDTRIGEMAFCGLVFHYNKKIPGKLAYYVFYIYADGYYGAKRVIGDNAEVILPLTRSEYIDIDRPNVLAVDARGTRFDLYINGRYVDGFTDVRIDGGGFGFYVSQQARAAFDNFAVKVERRGGGPAEVEGPELVEGSSDDGPRAESGGADGSINPLRIPRDPNRPVYPWEVGVDKSETASKERAEARERELQDLANRRLEEDMKEPVQPINPPPVEDAGQAEDAGEDPAKPAEDGTAATEPVVRLDPAREDAKDDPAEVKGSEDGSQAADEDATYINVSLPGQQEAAAKPAVPAGEEEAEDKAGEEASDEPTAEEIMRRVRSDDEDWPVEAPPYVPPAEQQAAEGSAGNSGDGELKGIELPPLDLKAPADADEDGKQDDGTEEDATGDESPAADGDSLSLFPDQPAGTQAAVDPAREAAPSAAGNPGELKLPAGQSANDASREYDPFEGNPDVETVYDDFTEQRWPVADGDTSSYRYFGAAYEIDNTKSDTMAISYQQGSFTDARYGIDVEYLGGLDYVGYGLATRFSVEGGNVSYYGMFVSQSGEFLLLKVLGGKEYVLQDWTAVPNLSRTLSNRIGMELLGSSIQCIVNGEVVASVTDESLHSGGYALLCGPGTSTRFDNLTIKGLTEGDA